MIDDDNSKKTALGEGTMQVSWNCQVEDIGSGKPAVADTQSELCHQLDKKNYPVDKDETEEEKPHHSRMDLDFDLAEPTTVDLDAPEIAELRQWANQSNITHKQLSDLLNILRKRLLPSLPKTAKAFLQTTQATYNIRDLSDYSTDTEPGQFVYFGIGQGLKTCITDYHVGDIELVINIDGLPITKSGKICFWPILCKVFYNPDMYKPFTVALYCGTSKPKHLEEYFNDFIEELNNLLQEDFTVNEKKFKIRLKAIVADTPARALCKQTKGHGGYGACERCTIPGKPIKIANKNCTRIVYPGVDYPKRSNQSFRDRSDPEHHIGNSPLENISPEIDMVTIFPLDFMHLCIGVTKKLLEYWISGPLKVRLSLRYRKELTRRLLCLKAQVPKEFQRKPRGIDCLAKWKATEFRFFLLYCGPIVLNELLSGNLYKHFLLLHISFRILCNEQLAFRLKDKAREYLKLFLLALPMLYGDAAQVINMHNLAHIVDDVEIFGCDLSKINCFPFESYLASIKSVIRTPNQPLVQYCRRQYEKSLLPQRLPEAPSVFKIGRNVTVKEQIITKEIILNSFMVTSKTPNNVVLLNNGHVVEITKIFGDTTSHESLFIEGKAWKIKKNAYSYPRRSASVNVWKIKNNSAMYVVYPVTSITKKLIKLSLSMVPGGTIHTYVMALLHL